MTDRLKIPWANGARLTSPWRRLFVSPVSLALLGGFLLIVLLTLVEWIAELLWFRALAYEEVFWRLLFASVAMFAIAFIPVFVYVLLNLLVLARLTGVPQPNGRRLTPLLILGSTATAALSGSYSPASGIDSYAWSGPGISGAPILSTFAILASTYSCCRSSTSFRTVLSSCA